MKPSPLTTWKYLAPNPKSASKQLFLKDRRIRARDLYGMTMSAEEPMTPAQMAADYGLPLAAVEEAIAYCQTYPPEKPHQRRHALAGLVAVDRQGDLARATWKIASGRAALASARAWACSF